MSDYLQQIIKISSADYQTLCTNGTVTYNGVTLTGPNNNCLYITNDKIVPMDLDNSFILPVNKGGTNITSYSAGDILYASGATALAKLSGNTTTTNKFLRSVATTDGTAEAPSWEQLAINDIPNGIARGNGRIYYGTCETAADSSVKIVYCTAYDKVLTEGDVFIVKFDNTNSAAVTGLQLSIKWSSSDSNGTTAKNVKKLYRGAIADISLKTELNADTLGVFVYSGTYWILVNADYNTTYNVASVYCDTAATTADKTASSYNYYVGDGSTSIDKHYFEITMVYSNTAQNALTLNINSKGAKPIYINGTASSSTNYTLPRGKYLVYCDGTNYYFRTDGKLTADITGTASNVTDTVLIGHGGTGTATAPTQGGIIYAASQVAYASTGAGTAGQVLISNGANAPAWFDGLTLSGSDANSYTLAFAGTTGSSSKTTGAVTISGGLGVAENIYGDKVYGAVWNDYAEYRKQLYKIEPGRVVYDLDNGYVLQTEKRLMPGAQVVSDTFGFSIGETEENKTPLAVSGRVLVYTYRNRNEYHAGDAVCSAPNGTVDIMTREEIKEYPDAIIGIVSEIPNYTIWGEGQVPVNERIWIKVR